MKSLISLMVFSGLLAAQPMAGQRWAGRPAASAPTALKEALGLSDQQVQQLIDVRKQHADENRSLVQQLGEKRQAVSKLMQQANPDPSQVGQAMVELKRQQENLRARRADLQAKAQALLTPEQRTKLQQLQAAAAMAPALRQAVGFGLITPPQGAAGPGAGMRRQGVGRGRARMARPRI